MMRKRELTTITTKLQEIEINQLATSAEAAAAERSRASWPRKTASRPATK
ncbi:MAG: hypothetical protein WKG07_07155 [Hymenobacter sp.]